MKQSTKTLRIEIMSQEQAFDAFLKRFIREHIHALPTISFKSAHDYEFFHFLTMTSWRKIQNHPSSSAHKLKELQPLMNMFDKLDSSIDRPIQFSSIRALSARPDWKEIQKKARLIRT